MLLTSIKYDIQQAWLNYGTVFEKKTDLEEVKKLMNEKLATDVFALSASQPEGNFSSCLFSFIYRWESFNVGLLPINNKNVMYLRINKKLNEIMSMSSSHCNTKFYLLPTDDKDVNIFITETGKLLQVC